MAYVHKLVAASIATPFFHGWNAATTETGLGGNGFLGDTSGNPGTDVSFTPDGEYLMLARGGTVPPFWNIYKRSGDGYNQLGDVLQPLHGVWQGVFSPDGKYVGASKNTGNGIEVFSFNNGVLTKLPNPDSIPSGSNNGIAFSSDGTYMAVAISTTPFVRIWGRIGDQFLALGQPATLPTGAAQSVWFSPDDKYLVVAHATSPFISIYKRNGSSFTKLANPSGLPTGNAVEAKFSRDGKLLAVAHATSPFMTVYAVNSATDTFTKLANPTTLPPGAGTTIAISDSGNTIAHGSSVSPFISIFTHTSGVLARSGDIDSPGTAIRGLSFSPKYRLNVTSALTFPKFASAGTVKLAPKVTADLTFPRPFAVTGMIGDDWLIVEASFPLFKSDCMAGQVEDEPDAGNAPTVFLVPVPVGVDVAAPKASLTPLTGRYVIGDHVFPSPFSAEGLVAAIAKANADLAFPLFAVEGEATIRTIDGGGDFTFPLFESTGEINVPLGVLGDVSFHPFEGSGEINVPLGLIGDLSFPTGFASEGLVGSDWLTADLSFPVFTASGAGEIPFGLEVQATFPAYFAESELYIDPSPKLGGDIAFPAFQVAAELYHPLAIFADVSFPKYALDGLGDLPIPSWAEVTFPAFTAEGLGGEIHINDGVTFPLFAAEGLVGSDWLMADVRFPSPLALDGLVGSDWLAADVTFPRPFASDGLVGSDWLMAEMSFPSPLAVEGEVTFIWGAADVSFPTGFATDGLIVRPIHIDANMRYPKLTALGFGGHVNEVRAPLRFPKFAVEGVTKFGFKAVIAGTFPRFRVRGSTVEVITVRAAGVSFGSGGTNLSIGNKVRFSRAGKPFRMG